VSRRRTYSMVRPRTAVLDPAVGQPAEETSRPCAQPGIKIGPQAASYITIVLPELLAGGRPAQSGDARLSWRSRLMRANTRALKGEVGGREAHAMPRLTESDLTALRKRCQDAAHEAGYDQVNVVDDNSVLHRYIDGRTQHGTRPSRNFATMASTSFC